MGQIVCDLYSSGLDSVAVCYHGKPAYQWETCSFCPPAKTETDAHICECPKYEHTCLVTTDEAKHHGPDSELYCLGCFITAQET